VGRKIAFFPVAFLSFILVSATPVYAYHQKQVLGVSVSSEAPQIPPTAEGPGLILPDSPLFFLDKLKQNVRLLFAFTPEGKTRIYNAIAGERLAELRFMLLENNREGIEIAIEGVARNLEKASDHLEAARFRGKDVSELAKTINEDIKRKQDAMDILEEESTGELYAMVLGAQTSILKSKVKVEDNLPKHMIENEIRDNLTRQINKKIKIASSSSQELLYQIEELRREASEASRRSLRNREEALRKAIEKKNEILRKNNQRLFELEKKKQERLLQLQDRALENVREIVKKAQETASNYEQIKEVEKTGININTQTSQ